jgi:hypothetical protein
MSWLTNLLVKVFGMFALVFTGKQLGKASTKKEQAEAKVEEMRDDAEISSKPFVDSPFSRMRGKEK